MRSRLPIILGLALTSCTSHIHQDAIPPAPLTELAKSANVADRSWKPSFFDDIDYRAKLSNLERLESAKLPNDDFELRIWYGFGRQPLEGFVIKRSSGEWFALHLEGINAKRTGAKHDVVLNTPRSGWGGCWKRLCDAGVLTLPDEPTLGEEQVAPDARSYVVECNVAGTYRTYLYTSPETSNQPGAREMVKIGQIIFEEFNLKHIRARP